LLNQHVGFWLVLVLRSVQLLAHAQSCHAGTPTMTLITQLHKVAVHTAVAPMQLLLRYPPRSRVSYAERGVPAAK
jgi:hypothetical protein